jgi:hypothetical protein
MTPAPLNPGPVNRESPETESPRWRRTVKRAGEIVEPEANPAGAVYGIITAGALLAAESARRETTPEAAGAVAVALLLYWLAHAYSDALGERLEHHQAFRPRALLYQLRRSATIVRGSALPLTTMLLAWAAGASTSQAVNVALITAAVSLILLELISMVRSECGVSELLTQTVVSVVLGLGVLSLKVVLH